MPMHGGHEVDQQTSNISLLLTGLSVIILAIVNTVRKNKAKNKDKSSNN